MTEPLCPICRRPSRPEFRPFCSKRCADVDLQGWFSGRYAIPGREGEGAAPEPSGDADGS